MSTRANLALYIPAAVAGLGVLALLIFAAELHGRRRVLREARGAP